MSKFGEVLPVPLSTQTRAARVLLSRFRSAGLIFHSALDRRRMEPSAIPKMWDWNDTELMLGLLISFVIMTALIVLLIGCGSRLSSGAKIPCYLCENMVVYGSWDDHKKDCLRVYERHIEALPKLKVSTYEGHCLNLILI